MAENRKEKPEMDDTIKDAQPAVEPSSTDGTDAAILKELNLGADKPGTDENPLAGEVEARGEHAEIHTDNTITEDIKEFTPPPEPIVTPEGEANPDNPDQPAAAGATAAAPINPAVTNLTPDQQREAAARFVDLVIDTWTWIKTGAGTLVQVSKEDLVKLHRASKIDMNYPMPTGNRMQNGEPEFAPFAEIMEAYSMQSQMAFVVSPDFIKAVREPMIREFMKRGLGLTDLQVIAFYWGKEILNSTIVFFSMRAIRNNILEGQQTVHAELLSGKSKPAATSQNTTQTAAKETATEAKAEILDTAEQKGK